MGVILRLTGQGKLRELDSFGGEPTAVTRGLVRGSPEATT